MAKKYEPSRVDVLIEGLSMEEYRKIIKQYKGYNVQAYQPKFYQSGNKKI